MRVLLTGDQGYIGSVLGPMLQDAGYDVVGLDIGFFAENKLVDIPDTYPRFVCDLRDVSSSIFKDVDAVIHLAGLSNDPLGELAPGITKVINHDATVRFAKLAKNAGVGRFIYASSQSMYGVADTDIELDEYESEKNPVTAYAEHKWTAELALNDLNDESFTVVSFRPSTVFGASPRLRTDIVFNNLVACAYTTGTIEIKSDGTPWRPIVHVRDVCQAFMAGLKAPVDLISGKAYNVGVPGGNYTVREIAEAAARAVPGCDLKFTNEHTDPRSYRVCFDRINGELSKYFRPEWDLEKGGQELVSFFREVDFSEEMFRGKSTVRLQQINSLISDGLLGSDLRFGGAV